MGKRYWEDLVEGERFTCRPVAFDREGIVSVGKEDHPLPFHAGRAPGRPRQAGPGDRGSPVPGREPARRDRPRIRVPLPGRLPEPFTEEVELEPLLPRRPGPEAAKAGEERLQLPEDRVGLRSAEDLGEERPAFAE